MIYGDNPQKINERQDALGLTAYTYVPQISAIMQSGNLYVYAVNNPVLYRDQKGTVITPANVVGAVIGAGGGALLGTLVADYYGLTGWQRNAAIAGFTAGGAVLGWFAGPLVKNLAMTVATKLGLITPVGSAAVSSRILPEYQDLFSKSVEHIFSQKHIADGIMNLGSSEVDIFNKIINIANQHIRQWAPGSNEIRTVINGFNTTIRFYVVNGEIIKINAFVGNSARIIGNWIQ